MAEEFALFIPFAEQQPGGKHQRMTNRDNF
jgi:hypothetical protein